MQKSSKKRVKNVVLGVTSAALVAALTVSLTLAYLSDTDTVTNMFTSEEVEVKATLTEPTWDGDTTGDNNADYTSSNSDYTSFLTDNGYTYETDEDGNITYTDSDGNEVDAEVVQDAYEAQLGETVAASYDSGTFITKDPLIENTSELDEYVAINVEYQIATSYDEDTDEYTWTTVTAEQFNEIAIVATSDDGTATLASSATTTNSGYTHKLNTEANTITSGTTSDGRTVTKGYWIQYTYTASNDTTYTYYYSTKVEAGTCTEALFTHVYTYFTTSAAISQFGTQNAAEEYTTITTSSDGTTITIELDDTYTMPAFRIVLNGAAVSATDSDLTDEDGNTRTDEELLEAAADELYDLFTSDDAE